VLESSRSRLARIVYRVDAALGFGACVVLFAMMSLTFVDVVRRYSFNKSIAGSFEITELLMATLIFAGLPLVSRREEHVTVDLIDHFTSPALQRVHRLVVEFISGVILLGLGYLMWGKATQVASYGDTTTILTIKLAPFVYGMCVFLIVAGLVHLIKVFMPLALVAPPRSPAPGGERKP
jgi:TRAP-type transport system small permease protein